jgi:hypothetical protein
MTTVGSQSAARFHRIQNPKNSLHGGVKKSTSSWEIRQYNSLDQNPAMLVKHKKRSPKKNTSNAH